MRSAAGSHLAWAGGDGGAVSGSTKKLTFLQLLDAAGGDTTINRTIRFSPSKINHMKTSSLLFAIAAAVPFFSFVGLGFAEAFTITTALSIVAMIALDYDHSSSAKRPATDEARPAAATRTATERHPLAA
jgi:hypothetical protein